MKKIALAQIKVIPGDPTENLNRIFVYMEKAKQDDCDIVAFPELCLSGYLLSDKWTDDAFCADLMTYNIEIVNRAKQLNIAVIWGNVYYNTNVSPSGRDGRYPRCNAVYFTEKGMVDLRYKTLLPTYRIFDDQRYFYNSYSFPQDAIKPVQMLDGTKIGLEVCEDLWFRDYEINPTAILINQGADFIVNISASPFSVDKYKARDNCIYRLKEMHGRRFVPFLYVNNVGCQDNGKNIVTFDGGSAIYREDGKREGVGIDWFEDGILVTTIDEEKAKVCTDKSFVLGRGAHSPPPNITSIEFKYKAIIEAYKYIAHLVGDETKFIFGLSGGIDSALSMALAVKALGSNRILAFNLPSKFNSQLTKDAAELCAYKLGVKYEVIPIKEFIRATEDTFENKVITEFQWENIQAKIRGTTILSTLAAINNGVMVNNGNKVETALGYATLYGDINGVFCPLGDLTKEEIFEMSRFINIKANDNIIPEKLIPNDEFEFAVPPSAELKSQQIDPMWWGFDDRLLEALMNYNRVSPEQILQWYKNSWKECADQLKIDRGLFFKYGVGDLHKDNTTKETTLKFIEHLEWFIGCMQKSVFKRIQSPPIVLLSKSAFGFDYRESQLPLRYTKNYKRLRSELLNRDYGEIVR